MPFSKLPLPALFSQSSDATSLPDQVGARLVNGWVEKIGNKPIIRKLFGLEEKGLVNPVGTTPNLCTGVPNTAVANGDFVYYINGNFYSKANTYTAGTAPGNDVIVQAKYGAVAFDIDASGTVTAVEATGQAAAEFTTEALAIAALPAPDTSIYRMGWVTATNSGGTFTFGTNNMITTGTITVTFYNNAIGDPEVHPFPIDGLYWWDYLNTLVVVCNGRFFTQTSPGGTLTDITGDALTVIGPVTFASNSWCLMAASGGKIVTWHLYGSLVTTPTVEAGTSDTTTVKIGAFTYKIGGVTYSKASSETEPGNDIIPTNKYGAVAFDIDYAGTITVVEAAANSTGYVTYLAAFAGIAACADDKCRITKVAVVKAGGFTFGTTAIADADEMRYEVAPLYTAETTKFLADANAPTAVTHVAWMDDYFLANEVGSGRFWWSDGGDPTAWDALSFATAEGHSDILQALHTAWLEITLFGRDSVETYYNDGTSPFSRIDGGVMERGCLAPYSIVNASGMWVWLDKERRVITLEGRSYTARSGPYDGVIADIVDVTDAWAIYLTIKGHSFYCLTFPTVDRTFIWNITTDSWSEWGTWDSETATYGKWRGKSYCYARTWDLHLLGDSTTGKIYAVRPNLFLEGDATIRTLMLIAHTDHGTMAKKRSRRIKINVKRGQGVDGGAEPVFAMRYRDDNRAWSNERQIGLGLIGETPNILEIRKLGIYKTRQYEFTHTDNSDFLLNELEEEVEAIE